MFKAFLFLLGIGVGVTGCLIYYFHTERLVSAYDIKEEYTTTKVVSRIGEIKETALDHKEFWGRKGYNARVYLTPSDWHQDKIPQKMEMTFTGLPENWGVQMEKQIPQHEIYGPARIGRGMKMTNSFSLELMNPDSSYVWYILFYPKNKDADPNVLEFRDVRVHFDWKIQRIDKVR